MALSEALRAAARQGSGRRAALPENTKVIAQIVPTKKDIGYIEKRPFSKQTASPNSRITALALRFVVPDGEQYAGYNFFANVPNEFEIYSERKGGKVPSYQSLGLMKALGYDLESDEINNDSLKTLTDREILGKTVQLVLGVQDDTKFDPSDPDEARKAAENPLYGKRNSVKFINKTSGTRRPAASQPAPPRANGQPAWLAAPPATAEDPWAKASTAAQAEDVWASAVPQTI